MKKQETSEFSSSSRVQLNKMIHFIPIQFASKRIQMIRFSYVGPKHRLLNRRTKSIINRVVRSKIIYLGTKHCAGLQDCRLIRSIVSSQSTRSSEHV